MTDEKKIAIQQQGDAARKMWAAVVLAALDDAIRENRKSKTGDQGTEYLVRWMKSRDGREVMTNAGIEPGPRAWNGMV